MKRLLLNKYCSMLLLLQVNEVKSNTSSGSVFVWKRASQNSTATSTAASVSRDALQDTDQVCVYLVSRRLNVISHGIGK